MIRKRSRGRSRSRPSGCWPRTPICWRLSANLLATYAGTYELAPGREFVIVSVGDLLFVQGLNEPKLPLFVQSATRFMSTATPNGFEFVKDAQGRVTNVIVRGADGDLKAVRKSR